MSEPESDLASRPLPDDPGDLGRRVAARRRALGMSVEELARRAGMHPGYLEYVEHHAGARPSPAACARLAGALETSVSWLRGGAERTPDEPSGSPPQLLALDRSTSLELLRPGGVGRAVFVEGTRGPVALPVDFRMLDGAIVFRTGEGAIARALRAGSPLGIEVDHLDETLGEGWSVLVSGEAELVDDPEVVTRIDALGLKRWDGDHDLVVRLVPGEVSGRRIRRHEPTG